MAKIQIKRNLHINARAPKKFTTGKTVTVILSTTETAAWDEIGGNGQFLRYAVRKALSLCLHPNMCEGVCPDCTEVIPESFLKTAEKIQNFLTIKD